MIIVTGGAGFIGSNLIRGLNDRGLKDILVVDHLQRGEKFLNLRDLQIQDYCDRDEFLDRVQQGRHFGAVEAIFHQGACSVTTEWDGQYMMHYNFSYAKTLLHHALSQSIPFIYASSAAVYGGESEFTEDFARPLPLNVYGYSKLLFDQYWQRLAPPTSPVIGLRYFNVYGPREQFKNSMASVVFHFYHQWLESQTIRLFGECDGIAAGEQRRDFIHVDDVVAINLWFFDHLSQSGIFNVGTGESTSFNVIGDLICQQLGSGAIRYIEFPESLRGRYQRHTCAELHRLRSIGCEHRFLPPAEGVPRYIHWLSQQ